MTLTTGRPDMNFLENLLSHIERIAASVEKVVTLLEQLLPPSNGMKS